MMSSLEVTLEVARAPSATLVVGGDTAHTFGADEYVPIRPVIDEYAGPYVVAPDETTQTLATDGLLMDDDVTVAAISPDYVGSAIDRRDGDDLTVSGATVSVPAGYYEGAASASVPTASLGGASSSRTKTGGQLYTTVSWPSFTAGYLASHNPVSTSQILQDETVTPTTSAQTITPTSDNHYLESVTVSAIPPEYVVPSGTYTVTASGTHDVTQYASASVASATPTNSSDSEYITTSGVRKWRYRPKTIVPTAGWAAQRSASNPINGFWQTFDAIPTGTTVTPSTSAQTIGGADTMLEGAVTVGAVPVGTEGTPSAAKSVSGHTATVTPSVTNVAGLIDGGTHTGTAVTVAASELVSGTKSIAANGTGIDVTDYAAVDVAVPVPTPTYQSKSKSYTPTETAQSETVSPDTGYDGLSSVAVSVGAVSSIYVGSGITRRDSSSLSASGATVSVPAGYYENAASKAVSSGSATAPSSVSATGASISYGLTNITLSKANVSITPTVTPGYVSSGTAGNATVYLSATADFQPETDWHPSTSDQTILAGKILQGHQHIKAVTMTNLDAGNIKQGVTVKIGDASDDDCVTSVTGTYTGGGGGSSMNVQVAQSTSRATSSTYTSVISLTCSKAGTYDVYWDCFRSSTGGTNGSQLYIGGTAHGTANTTFTNHAQTNHLTGVTLAANQTVAVYARSRGSNYYAYVGTLVIKQTA